jgi:hypothetical protein
VLPVLTVGQVSTAIPSPLTSEFGALASTSRAPSPSVSDSSSRLSKRPRLNVYHSSLLRQQSYSDLSQQEPWSSGHQARFETRIARLTASCGFTFNWVADEEWHGFCAEFVPGAKRIERRSLVNTLIPAEVNRFREAAKIRSKGLEATIQCDGWSGVNFHHYLAFMVTTSSREVNITSASLLLHLSFI